MNPETIISRVTNLLHNHPETEKILLGEYYDNHVIIDLIDFNLIRAFLIGDEILLKEFISFIQDVNNEKLIDNLLKPNRIDSEAKPYIIIERFNSEKKCREFYSMRYKSADAYLIELAGNYQPLTMDDFAEVVPDFYWTESIDEAKKIPLSNNFLVLGLGNIVENIQDNHNYLYHLVLNQTMFERLKTIQINF